jgi:1-acyl-sn-glycerol-3-phosphate acyltransferase
VSVFYRFAQLISFFYFKAFHRFEVYGLDNIPSSGPFILASNHQSFFDPPALGCRLPRNLHYFARDSLFFWPLGILIRNLNSIPVNRSTLDIKTLKLVLSVLNQGNPLLVFPEGTRSCNDQIQSGKKGIGLLLAKSGVPVVPAKVIGGYKVLGPGMIFPRIGKQIVIKYGSVVYMKDLDPGKSASNRYEVIAQRVISEITRI